MEETFSALLSIIRQKLHAIDAHHGDNGISFKISGKFAVALPDDLQFAVQDRRQKIAVAAGRLQKTAVDPFGLVLDQVQHGIDFPFRGKDFAMIRDALF